VPDPSSGLIVSSQVVHCIRADEVLAAVQSPSQSDLAKLHKGASNLDRLLAASSVNVEGLIEEFNQARNPLQRPTE
jgi:hypothetical protein